MIRKIYFADVNISVCLAAMLLTAAVFATTANAATGAYFGQTPPGTTPTIFASGVLSLTTRMEARLAFSPDGNECFFTVPTDYNFSSVKLYYTKCVSNVWTTQSVASFSPSGTFCGQPCFSADGNNLYFGSNHNGTTDIWVSTRTTSGWGAAQVLSSSINSTSNDGNFSQSTDGTIYFDSNRSGGSGLSDIWRITAGSSVATNLGTVINTSTYDSDPCVSPDGSYLIFASYRSGLGQGDLYVSFADGNNGWSTPVNLNTYCPGVNTDSYEYGASLSSDGKYLFYTRLSYTSQTCDDYWVANPFYVPEPATVIQLGLAAMLLGLFRIRCFRRRV